MCSKFRGVPTSILFVSFHSLIDKELSGQLHQHTWNSIRCSTELLLVDKFFLVPLFVCQVHTLGIMRNPNGNMFIISNFPATTQTTQ